MKQMAADSLFQLLTHLFIFIEDLWRSSSLSSHVAAKVVNGCFQFKRTHLLTAILLFFDAVSSLSAYAEHMQYNLGQDWAADVVITNQKRLDTEMKRKEIFHFGNLYSSGAVCYTNPAISGTRYHGINVFIVRFLHLHSSRSLCLPLLFSASWDFINLAKCLDK